MRFCAKVSWGDWKDSTSTNPRMLRNALHLRLPDTW
ncbi:Uncharacterised protein [Klebsiella pneumoniae]|nr:Uncharacterised protein [Klebsiella pneumoniae]